MPDASCLILADSTNQYPPSTVAVFLRTKTTENRPRSPTVPVVSHDITINLLDEKARDPAVPQTAQWNIGCNTKGAQGDGQNEIKTTINLSWNTRHHTHPGRGGGEYIGGEGGNRGGRGEQGRLQRGQRRGEERHVVLCLLFLGE